MKSLTSRTRNSTAYQRMPLSSLGDSVHPKRATAGAAQPSDPRSRSSSRGRLRIVPRRRPRDSSVEGSTTVVTEQSEASFGALPSAPDYKYVTTGSPAFTRKVPLHKHNNSKHATAGRGGGGSVSETSHTTGTNPVDVDLYYSYEEDNKVHDMAPPPPPPSRVKNSSNNNHYYSHDLLNDNHDSNHNNNHSNSNHNNNSNNHNHNHHNFNVLPRVAAIGTPARSVTTGSIQSCPISVDTFIGDDESRGSDEYRIETTANREEINHDDFLSLLMGRTVGTHDKDNNHRPQTAAATTTKTTKRPKLIAARGKSCPVDLDEIYEEEVGSGFEVRPARNERCVLEEELAPDPGGGPVDVDAYIPASDDDEEQEDGRAFSGLDEDDSREGVAMDGLEFVPAETVETDADHRGLMGYEKGFEPTVERDAALLFPPPRESETYPYRKHKSKSRAFFDMGEC